MRSFCWWFLAMYGLPVVAATADGGGIWAELRTKREGLTSFHQEFDVARSFNVGGKTQSSKWSMEVDGARKAWRVRSISGSGGHLTIYDGRDRFEVEAEGNEYQRVKHRAKEKEPQPDVYSTEHLDLAKAAERDRKPCGLIGSEHTCVIIDIPVKPWSGSEPPGSSIRMLGGTRRVVMDTVTGLLISARTLQAVESGATAYQSDITYLLKRMSYNEPVKESLFVLPATATNEVEELSTWNAEKMRKQLTGRTAPNFKWTDMEGKTVKLSDLKGKTVLLDFWATWCGPCRADGPSLDKLYDKFGGKNLMIIGVSVDEERPVVQSFLGQHPRRYPIALTTENAMPRTYQVGVFPTYVVIDGNGNLAWATEGDQGFAQLKKHLKKAGMETE